MTHLATSSSCLHVVVNSRTVPRTCHTIRLEVTPRHTLCTFVIIWPRTDLAFRISRITSSGRIFRVELIRTVWKTVRVSRLRVMIGCTECTIAFIISSSSLTVIMTFHTFSINSILPVPIGTA
jgi:hypothetical protein